MNFFKAFFFCLVVVNPFGICFGQQNTAILSGNSKAFKQNDKVLMISTTGYKDSTYINNYSFKFQIPATKAALYFIYFPTASKSFKYAVFIRQHSEIHIAVDSTYANPEISGDQFALEENNFWKQATSISQKYRLIEKEIEQTKDSLKVLDLNEALKNEKYKITAFATGWVMQHRASPFSVLVVRLFVADNNNPGTEDTVGEKYFDYLTPEAKANNRETEILENLFSKYNNKYASNLSIKDVDSKNYIYLNDKKYSKIPLGSTAPNFNLKDTAGKAISLDNFKGGYLLIDFWASWCGPCRENNPSLKELERHYKTKGLQVISISIDKDAKKWKKAIREDKMTWAQGSDLIGANSIAALRYGITAVPTYILLDPNGKIILKSVGSIKFIRKKIKEILL